MSQSLFLLNRFYRNFPRSLVPFAKCNRFSTRAEPAADATKPSNLSARLSFVFDQIDALEKSREREFSMRDEALQRIRSWRESKAAAAPDNAMAASREGPFQDSNVEARLTAAGEDRDEVASDVSGSESGVRGSGKLLEIVHPWKEWVEFMERLVEGNYFDHKRKDEDRMAREFGFVNGTEGNEACAVVDIGTDVKAVQNACLNFGKDRFDILRSLSRQDIQILVGYGCPTTDKKVSFSAKLLRKLVHLDEGDVCSSCHLRSTCEKAYIVPEKEDEARTVDVMRVLLAFGLDHHNGTLVNKSILKEKRVKTVVRKLLHDIVRLSAVPIDPSLPPPIIKKPPPKVKQPPPPPKRRVGRDDIEMKKGDWLCTKCDFMNFAKNTVCLQCDAKRPKRQLLPGEWECPECNFLNYRRNMACFHCECKRPPDQYMEDRIQEKQQNHASRLKINARRLDVSNAWNFDFDDDESDGADVAAFEYADSSAIDKKFPQHQGVNHLGREDVFRQGNRFSMVGDGEYLNSEDGSRAGFNDFDDEEDDLDSYEVDKGTSQPIQNLSFRDLSRAEIEDEGSDSECELRAQHSRRPLTNERSRGKGASAGSDEDERDWSLDDEEPATQGNWRSSHVADTGLRNKNRSSSYQSRQLSHGSDEDFGLGSDLDDSDEEFVSHRNKSRGNKMSGRKGSLFNDSESDDDDVSPRAIRSRGMKADFSRRANDFGARDSTKRLQSNGNTSRAPNSLNGYSGRNLRSGFNSKEDGDRGRKMESRPRSSPGFSNYNDRSGNDGGFRHGRRTEGGPRSSPRFSNYNDRSGSDGGFRHGRRTEGGPRSTPRFSNYNDRSGSDGGFRHGRRTEGGPRSSPRFSNYNDRSGSDGSFRHGRRTEGGPRSSPRYSNYDDGGGRDDDFRNRRRVIER